MKRSVISSLFLFAGVFLFVGCAEKEDLFGKQKSTFVSFLEKTHQPRLIPVEDLEPGSREGVYATLGDAVYRYIDVENYYDPDRENKPLVTEDSWVTLTYRAYLFNNTYVRMAGLTPGAWDFAPLSVDMRNAGIIKGLRLALVGCREGDRVEAYMTYNMAYGDKTYLYFIPKESPVAVFFSVDKVE